MHGRAHDGTCPLLSLLISSATLYGLFAGALYALADQLIFVPHPPGYRDEPGFIHPQRPDGTPFTAIWLPNPAARWTILYSHGNAEDLGDVLPTLRALYELGFSVLGYDYPGYGRSPGVPTEASVTETAEAAYAHLIGALGVSPTRLIAYGRSVGGGPTVALAAHHPLAAAIPAPPATRLPSPAGR